MIKVLHKACDILELLAQSPVSPRTLREITERLEINPGTCANILKTLVARGLVEQVAPKKGYVLGPLAYMLAGKGPYRRDLLAAAKPVIVDLVAEIKETAVLATLKNGKRYLLYHLDGNRSLQIRHDTPFLTDSYLTATGRVLLAHLDEADRKAFLAVNGAPGAAWPEAADESRLRATLDRLRQDEIYIDTSRAEVVQMAVPLRESDRVIAALGLAMPAARFKGEHRKRMITRLKAAGRKISKSLADGKSN